MKRFRRKLPLGALMLALALPFVVHPALAQNVYANVHGTITDSSGAVLTNSAVSLLNINTGISTPAKVDSKGYYVFPQLQIGGPYTLTIEAPGFKKFQLTGIMLAQNDNRNIDASLEPGSNTTVIQVQAAAVQVETSDTQLRTDLNSFTIESLPLLGRDVVELQKTAPGVVESADRFGTFSTNGNQTQQNSYLLDGLDINDGPLQQAGITPNPDALGEFQLITSTLNPEYYRNSGAIVSETIKSGSNSIHGDGFEFYRDTFLNNGNYFSPTRPPFHQNIYGGTLGGPLIKDRLFGFVAYQGLRNATASTQNTFTLSPAELSGAFTGVTGNASSTNPNGNVLPFTIGSCLKGSTWASCFPSGSAQISPSNFNSIAYNIAQKYSPAPTTTIGGLPATYFNALDSEASDQGIVRIDAQVTPDDVLWASSIFESNPTFESLPFQTGATVPGFAENDARHFKIFNASYTHAFNSTTINELRIGYYRFNFASTEPAQVQSPSSFGFNIAPQNSGAASLPTIAILNGPTYGFSTNGPQPRKDENYDYNDNFTKILGAHNLKFGAHIEKFVVSNPFFADNSGFFQFNGSGTYSSGNPILDYLVGIPDSYSQQSGGFIDAEAWELYGYAQDSWKTSPSFTLNYGLAWDVETPNANHQDGGIGVSCFTLSTATSSVFPGGPPGLLWPGDPGCNNHGGPTTKYNHLAPRLGFAWSPETGPAALIGENGHHDFSLRGGFGVYYNRDAEEGSLQNLSSPPFSKTTQGAADLNGSPGFANPFVDVAGASPTVTNPFPFNPPAAHSQINWLNFGGLNINAFQKGYSVPISYNFNLNVQRALPGAMVLSVGYVGSVAHHLISNYDADPITAAGHAACLASSACIANRPFIHALYPNNTALAALTNPVNANGAAYYTSVGAQSTTGSSNYHSLQIQLEKAPTRGLSFRLSYTYSHALDNSSGLESSGFNGRGYNFAPGFSFLSYGDSDYDARHRLAAYYIYQVPILTSMRNNWITREAFGGWNFSGITALQTGFPITLRETGDFNSLWCDSYYFYSCPDSPQTSTFHVKSLNPRTLHSFSGGAPGNYWFDPTLFSPEPIGTFGNTKRNFFHGPGYNYSNMSLYKNVPFSHGESRYIQLRLEAFNVFNHPNFAKPGSNFLSGSFGTITSVIQPSGNGDPQPARAVQLGGKIVF